ncbi:STAS domain-containing protein [Thiohalophilus sp.]|uniref:STAS domain-containing protein n=1 Tax=Thiohalophilus sp. TaxID=3028392 RepID=UPI002ACDBCD2|nr:STAS domain-containing protein [Thiohalophilus sp.]MDZ7804291.1 STAS domain-containing protein [Thiohalophilus sp.]
MTVSSQFTDDGKTLIIQVEGDFDYNLHKAFRDVFEPDEQVQCYVVDLSRTEQMDSAALGLLLWLREQAGGERAQVTLQGASKRVRQILELSRFERLFNLK